MVMDKVYLLLGSNVGSRLENLQQAINLLQKSSIKVLEISSVYETAPWGKTDQDWYYNAVIAIDSGYAPYKLLEICLEVERKLGRIRHQKWGERIIDIDLIYFKNVIIDSESLTLPHPQISNRKFTLMPLIELGENRIHPIYKKDQKTLMEACDDPLTCLLTSFKLTNDLN